MSFSTYAEEILRDAELAVESGDEKRIRDEIDRVNREFDVDEICLEEHTLILQVLQEALGIS